MKKQLTLLVFLTLLNNFRLLKCASYLMETDSIGIRNGYFVNRLIAGSVAVANYGKCVRMCTDDKTCYTGEYTISSKMCNRYTDYPSNNHLEANTDKMIFYKSNYLISM
jgi:hypothetical protein